MRSRQLHILLLTLCLTSTSSTRAQTPAPAAPQAFPEVTLFDWTITGIVSEKARLVRGALEKARQSIAAQFMTQPEPLAALIARRGLPPMTLNQTQLLQSTLVGTRSARVPLQIPALGILPIWCSVADADVVALAIIDGRDGRFYGAPHLTITRDDWRAYLKSPGTLARIPPRLTEQLGQALRQMEGISPSDALHVQLDLAQETTRADQGSSLCLNLMVAHQLSSQYQVAQPVGAELWAATRRVLSVTTKPLRSTRRIVASWSLDRPLDTKSPRRAPDRLKLPLSFSLSMRHSESVLGQSLVADVGTPTEKGLPLPTLLKVDVKASPAQELILGGTEPLKNFLEREKKTLLLSDAPRISKVYGAWVYLDKGRAWGLHMDDRLVIGGGSEPIKGHVVGFFGPELGIRSPGGYPIQEGAIVFVRKGQRQTKPGMTIAFDSQTYPTPWPPKSQLAH